MKTIKNILIFAIIAVSFASCTKDEDGQWIQYYKCKGEGYILYRLPDGNLIPYAEGEVRISSIVTYGGLFVNPISHSDYTNTDENGYYSCRFVKKIDRNNVEEIKIIPCDIIDRVPNGYSYDYYISSGCYNGRDYTFSTNIISDNCKNFKIDTLIYKINKNE